MLNGLTGQEILLIISNLRIVYLEQTKNSDKEEYTYSGYRIIFNSTD